MPATQSRSAPTAADPISQFFTSLTEPGHLATLEAQSATLRFDVTADGVKPERWYVTVRDGDLSVARHGGQADAVITVGRPAAEALFTGRLNAQAAILRGLLGCEGSMAACMMFQRCLPSPPGSAGRVPPISSQAVMARHRPQQPSQPQRRPQ